MSRLPYRHVLFGIREFSRKNVLNRKVTEIRYKGWSKTLKQLEKNTHGVQLYYIILSMKSINVSFISCSVALKLSLHQE